MRAGFLFLLLAGVLIWKFGLPGFSGGYGHLSPGRAAPDDPVQESLKVPMGPIAYKDYNLQPLFRYSLQALVLGKKSYMVDGGADLSPVDLALGWGPMSNPAPLKALKISQSGRFYHYRWSDAPPLAPSDIAVHSANTHIIPANDVVEKTLGKVRKGDVVHLQGYLVNATGENGYYWNSSVVRTDTGKGACELFYVESVKIL
jgi:hypothetical protein